MPPCVLKKSRVDMAQISPGKTHSNIHGLVAMWPFQIRCSIVVSIPAYHAGDPGSIPGGGVICQLHYFQLRKAPMKV